MKNKRINLKTLFASLLIFTLLFSAMIPAGNVYASNTGEISTEGANTLPTGNASTNVDNSNNPGTTNSNSNTNNGEEVGLDVNIKPITEEDLINNVMNSNVTIDTIGNKIISKLYEAANLLQRAAVPIAIIAFMVGVLLFIWGALSKRATVIPGIISMLAAIVGYAFCVNAPAIVIWASSWLLN